jgi:hypothetical protein
MQPGSQRILFVAVLGVLLQRRAAPASKARGRVVRHSDYRPTPRPTPAMPTQSAETARAVAALFDLGAHPIPDRSGDEQGENDGARTVSDPVTDPTTDAEESDGNLQ